MGQNARLCEYSVQISAFQSFQIKNCDLKTIFQCSSSTIHRAAETAVCVVGYGVFAKWWDSHKQGLLQPGILVKKVNNTGNHCQKTNIKGKHYL